MRKYPLLYFIIYLEDVFLATSNSLIPKSSREWKQTDVGSRKFSVEIIMWENSQNSQETNLLQSFSFGKVIGHVCNIIKARIS